MRIKVAIIDNDELYLRRLVSAFNDLYASDFELLTFSDVEIAENSLRGRSIDVLLIGEVLSDTVIRENLPFQTKVTAYFAESKDIDNIKDCEAICKYQKLELINKAITALMAGVLDDRGQTVHSVFGASDANIYAFSSATGGTGVSTVAAGFAYFLARVGQKTLYLNLETVNSTDTYFSDEGQYGFSDIIYAIISNKGNLGLKIKSYVKTDSSGVMFFSPAKTVLDMCELTSENIIKLVSELVTSGEYDNIIVDIPISFGEETEYIFKNAKRVFLVSDGTAAANKKTVEAYKGFEILDTRKGSRIAGNISIIYNKFSDVSGTMISEPAIDVKGGIVCINGSNKPKDVAMKISNMAMWDNIMKL